MNHLQVGSLWHNILRWNWNEWLHWMLQRIFFFFSVNIDNKAGWRSQKQFFFLDFFLINEVIAFQKAAAGISKPSNHFEIDRCEGDFCTEADLDANVRLRVLQLRASEVPEFKGLCLVPAFDSQVLRKTLEVRFYLFKEIFLLKYFFWLQNALRCQVLNNSSEGYSRNGRMQWNSETEKK